MTTKPTPLPVNVAGIPAEWQVQNIWLVWKYEPRDDDGKWTKRPYIATAVHRKARVNDPTTFGTFDAAMAAYLAKRADGIGIALPKDCTAYDQDHNRDLTNARRLNTYIEWSAGGDGLHAVARGQKPGDRCKNGDFELYDYRSNKYFTVTGHHIAGFPTTVEERTTEIAYLYAHLFPAPAETTCQQPASTTTLLSDEDVLVKAVAAANGDKFLRLWRGEWNGTYESHSEADFALCCILAFWTGRNAQQIDRLFRQSGLIQDKWNEKRGQQKYGERLIDRACQRTQTTYEPTAAIVAPLVGVSGLRGLHGIR